MLFNIDESLPRREQSAQRGPGTANMKQKRRMKPPLLAISLLACMSAPTSAMTTEYIHTDALGSVVAITDSNRAVIERRDYEPFGEQLEPTTQNGPSYAGHVHDDLTDLTYMQQRYYEPELGRFLSVDPVATLDNGDLRNFNRYAYAYGNPYLFNDPDGRLPDRPMCEHKPITTELSRTSTQSGSIVVSRQVTTSQGENQPSTTKDTGTLVLLPQRSLGGAPANPGPNVTNRLLNFSSKEGKPVQVTSGQRSLEQNRAVGGAARSQHLQDNAADVRIEGYTPTQTADAAHASGEFNRVNEYTDGRGVHVDLMQGGTQGRFTDWTPQRR